MVYLHGEYLVHGDLRAVSSSTWYALVEIGLTAEARTIFSLTLGIKSGSPTSVFVSCRKGRARITSLLELVTYAGLPPNYWLLQNTVRRNLRSPNHLPMIVQSQFCHVQRRAVTCSHFLVYASRCARSLFIQLWAMISQFPSYTLGSHHSLRLGKI